MNSNLAQFANETNTFSEMQSTATEMENTLQQAAQQIENNIEIKNQSGEYDANLEELNSLTREINDDNAAKAYMRTDVKLRIANRIVALASNASRPSNEDGDSRNYKSPTHSHFSTGSFNVLEDYAPRVLLAIDASGSMWCKETIMIGAANLLSSIASRLKTKGVTMDYAFWDDGCDIPRPFSIQKARDIARGDVSVSSYTGVVKLAIGGGGTNVYSIADRLSPYYYPPELNGDGTVKPRKQRKVKYDAKTKKQYKLSYGTDYDLIIIYSDFCFPSSPAYSIPSNPKEIKWRFDQITVSPTRLCCVCCHPQGERQTPQTFKKMVTWIPYEMWQKEIEAYSFKKPE